MNDIVGIDLGTTNSLIGIIEAGFPILIAGTNGSRLTPSIVHFPKDAIPLVGQSAARMREISPQQTTYSIKRLIGLHGNERPEEDSNLPFRLDRKSGQSIRVLVNDRS